METIRGKTRVELDLDGLEQRLAGHAYAALDLGTGDGRYVCHLAQEHPGWLVIGVDACRENLRERSRTSPPNTLFVIATAQDLPHELQGRISHLTINFPWGSLLDALLARRAGLAAALGTLAAPQASLEVRLNSGALAEMGRTLQAGAHEICENLCRSGWWLGTPRLLPASSLQAFPSTWARRLAYGRDPRAILIGGSVRA